ncbi:MAG: hypothetical protein H3C54_08935 [Taibaiella sp.]|nr:hypothetical protein [Taibaiella sp.]
MDQRQTFSNLAELKAILQHDDFRGFIAHLIIDRDGLTRMSGYITDVEATMDGHNFIKIVNNVSTVICLTEIVAVNGLFRSDYSEC